MSKVFFYLWGFIVLLFIIFTFVLWSDFIYELLAQAPGCYFPDPMNPDWELCPIRQYFLPIAWG